MKVVGITAHTELISGSGDPAPLRHHVAGAPYAKAVARAGAVPVILPILDPPPDSVDALLDHLDALVITGGCDVDPASYGADPHPEIGVTRPDRDAADIAIARAAVSRNLPTLAICRGIQVLNVALGGSLMPHVDDHMRPDLYNATVHTVSIEAGSALGEIVGSDQLGVNTLHHQVIDRLADGLRTAATNEDGHIEAVVAPSADRVLGVQWHPELLRHREDHLAIFRWLLL